MLRGINKQIVVVKDTGSPLFEEAIFIVRPSQETAAKSEAQMAEEAKNIVSDCIRRHYGAKAGRPRILRWLLSPPGLLALGVAAVALLVLIGLLV